MSHFEVRSGKLVLEDKGEVDVEGLDAGRVLSAKRDKW